MKTFLKLTVTFSIIIACMIAPSPITSALLGLFIGGILFEFFREYFVD